jgi:hypothetical protein
LSIAAIDWAFKAQNISSPAKFVLIALADAHNGHTGDCFPRIKRVMRMTMLGERTIHRATAELVEAGLLRKELITDEDGRTKGMRYHLALPDRQEGVSDRQGVGASQAGGRVPDRQVPIKNNRKEETGKNNQGITPSPSWPPAYKEEFWVAWPKKVEKEGALRKLEQIKRRGDVSFEEIMDGVRRLVASNPDLQFTKNPSAWLNNGCWTDQPVPQSERSMSNVERTREAIKSAFIDNFVTPNNPEGNGQARPARSHDAGFAAIPYLPRNKCT